MRRGARTAPASGFTLVEILVSLVASTIVLAGLFAIVSAGTKGFIVQSQIAELQLDLRFAMERIKADLRMAAFLGTADSSTDPRVCPKPDPAVRALLIEDDADTAPNAGANPFIVADRLRLLGSYVSSDYYLTANVAGSTFTLQSQSFPPTAARYAEIFNPSGFLVVRTYDTGNLQLLPISSSDFGGGTVTTSVAPLITSSGGSCGLTGAVGEGHELSVVNYVNYRLVADPLAAPADAKLDLVREALASDGATPTVTAVCGANVSGVTVGEYIIDLQVSATADTALGGADPSIPAAPAAASLFDGDGVGDAPGTARTVIVTLTARTAREDPDFPNIPRASAADPIRSFDVDPAVVGAARVRTLRVEIPLTNFVLGAR